MNEDRRKRIFDAAAELEAVKEEEQEAFDNMPESLQGAERGQAMEAAIEALEDAVERARAAAEGE